MVLIGEVEPFVSGPRDELGDADIISSGGKDFGVFWARVIRTRWARVAAVPLLAGLVAAAALLIPRPHPATRLAAPGQRAAITNTTAAGGSGAFAGGTAGGRQWQLDVQDIADPGSRCLPGVSIDGNDAYPLFAGQHPQSPVGDPAFVTLGPESPGAGFAFLQVPPDADWLWADPVGGFQLGVAPVTVTACGQQFRLVGFAYPLTAPLRIHLSFRDRPEASYAVPYALSAPRASLEDPQVDGVWQGPDGTHGEVASGTIASGQTLGEQWSIGVLFGTAGDCFTIRTSLLGDSTSSRPERTTACGPVSTPEGPSTIMVLPVGSPRPGSQGVGYAISVGSGADHLTAELSDGSNVSARPIVVAGRKYAAFFVPDTLHMFWLNWVDANDRPIAGFTGLPGYGFMQFWPNGLPAMKTEAWSMSWAN
jgi:hypothetical protein